MLKVQSHEHVESTIPPVVRRRGNIMACRIRCCQWNKGRHQAHENVSAWAVEHENWPLGLLLKAISCGVYQRFKKPNQENKVGD